VGEGESSGEEIAIGLLLEVECAVAGEVVGVWYDRLQELS